MKSRTPSSGSSAPRRHWRSPDPGPDQAWLTAAARIASRMMMLAQCLSRHGSPGTCYSPFSLTNSIELSIPPFLERTRSGIGMGSMLAKASIQMGG